VDFHYWYDICKWGISHLALRILVGSTHLVRLENIVLGSEEIACSCRSGRDGNFGAREKADISVEEIPAFTF